MCLSHYGFRSVRIHIPFPRRTIVVFLPQSFFPSVVGALCSGVCVVVVASAVPSPSLLRRRPVLVPAVPLWCALRLTVARLCLLAGGVGWVVRRSSPPLLLMFPLSLYSRAGSFVASLTLDDVHRWALVLNALWFGAAWACFSVAPHSTVRRLLLPNRKEDQTQQRALLAASLRFLGNMNLACAALCAMLLLRYDAFPTSEQKSLLCAALALMHLSQWAGNVPLAVRELATGKPGLWPVLRGPMLSIFLTDAAMAILDATLAAAYWQPEIASAVWAALRHTFVAQIGGLLPF